jgi:hypothetical protein
VVQTVLFFILLQRSFTIHPYWGRLCSFLVRVALQTVTLIGMLALLYHYIDGYLATSNTPWAIFFLNKMGFWLWYGPLMTLTCIAWIKLRTFYGIQIRFLDA